MGEKEEDIFSQPYRKWAQKRPINFYLKKIFSILLLRYIFYGCASIAGVLGFFGLLYIWLLLLANTSEVWNVYLNYFLIITLPIWLAISLFASMFRHLKNKYLSGLYKFSVGLFLVGIVFEPLYLFINERFDYKPKREVFGKLVSKRITWYRHSPSYKISVLTPNETPSERTISIAQNDYSKFNENNLVRIHLGSGFLGIEYIYRIEKK